MLNTLFLIEEELLALPILYLSRYIIANKADDYRLLLDVTRAQAWEPWVHYVLKGVEETAQWATQKIAALRALQATTIEHARKTAPKIFSRELVDVNFEQPHCRIQNVVERKIAGRQAASGYLKKLANIGVLKEVAVGREKRFIHPKLMQLLTRDGNRITAYP